MRVRQINEKFSDKVYAVVYEPDGDAHANEDDAENAHNDLDELERAFLTWSDIIMLREFFMKYRRDLEQREPNMSVKNAVRHVRDEAQDFHALLKSIVDFGSHEDLKQLFKPLDNRERGAIPYELQMMKAARPRSWLRLYALRYGDSFIITEFAIKITDDMTRPHLKKELDKLYRVQKFLEIEQNEKAFVYLEI